MTRTGLILIACIAGCNGEPREVEPLEGGCIEEMQKTGTLWGIREVRANPDGSVTLSESRWSGPGCALFMLDANGQPAKQVTLKPGASCRLTDGHHAFLRYTYLRGADGKLQFEVLERFDARAFGDGVKEATETLAVSGYRHEDTEPEVLK